MNRAAVQHQQPVDGGEQRVHHVLDPHDRDAAGAHGLDQRHQHAAFVLGQSAGDFVEQQHARLGRQRARQFKPLAIEQRQAAGAPVGLVGEPAALEQFGASARKPTLR